MDFFGVRVLTEEFNSHVVQIMLNAKLGCVLVIDDPVCENTGFLAKFADDWNSPDVLLHVRH